MRRVSVFGSTGSVGQNTVDVLRRSSNDFDVVALTGGQNVDLLIDQAKQLSPQRVTIADVSLLEPLAEALSDTGIEVTAGRDAILEAARCETDWAMSAIVGFAGLEVSLELALSSKKLALANKESLVCAGTLLRHTCDAHHCALIPVDSEHSGVFQAMTGANIQDVERVIITASGGPFLDHSLEGLKLVTPSEAANHPNWDMGLRISIDSASMFNKAMEVIEAKELFDLRPEQIEVLIHRQSIVHAIVGYNDGNMLSHMGSPDMRHAISYALNWPNRDRLNVDRLDLGTIGTLTFEVPDLEKFPALKFAEYVMIKGGLSGCVFNAAKETALDLFLEQKIAFPDMAGLVETALSDYTDTNQGDPMILADIKAADLWARAHVRSLPVESIT